VRGDHNGIFGWQTSPRLGATFHPGGKLVAKLLYGEAFRAPSFREFFTVDETGQFPEGNRALRPESIRTFEASLDYTFSSYAAFHLLAYRESTSDAIYSEDNRPYANHPGDTIYGTEAGLKLAWPNRLTVYLNGSYIWTDLYNIPHKQLNGGFNAPLGKHWNWNLQASWVSERPRDPDDRFYYDPGVTPYKRPDPSGYLLVNSTLRLLEVVPGLEFRLSVYNLLDRDFYDPTYEPTKYYDLQAPGRTFLLRAVYRF
jgi:iron complex outermembrane receptor protein